MPPLRRLYTFKGLKYLLRGSFAREQHNKDIKHIQIEIRPGLIHRILTKKEQISDTKSYIITSIQLSIKPYIHESKIYSTYMNTINVMFGVAGVGWVLTSEASVVVVALRCGFWVALLWCFRGTLRGWFCGVDFGRLCRGGLGGLCGCGFGWLCGGGFLIKTDLLITALHMKFGPLY